MRENTPIIIVGAGPVGLAAALLLADGGHRVTVYEAAEEMDLRSDNSYPIGVNPRGQEALRRIDPALLEALRSQGEVVKAFQIHKGRRRIARLESGTLIATTRAFLNQILMERVRSTDAIDYVPGHRLESLSVTDRTLTFATSKGEVSVDAADARVLAADGVWSKARGALAEQMPSFDARVEDWGVQFRVVFSHPGAEAPDLDPADHHIFTSKGIYTATLSDGRWCVVLTAIHGDEAEALLLSKDGSDAHVRALRAHVQEHAALTAPLLSEEDYRAFFGRKPFAGAVVRCDRIAFEEWLLLLGDAAHSVVPPTGEGVNSGLEDAFLLAEYAARGSATWFADFEAARLPDLAALGEYATVLKDNLRSTDPVRGGADVVVRIVDSVAARLHLPSARVEDRLFGHDAGLTPYRDAIGPWIRERRVLFPIAKGVVGGVRRALGTDRTTRAAHAAPVARTDGPARKITVVGGSRGTGRAVVEAALAANHDVTVVSRSGTGVGAAHVVTGDATDPDVARRAVAGADAVIVCVGGVKGKTRPRTEVTRAVVDAMRHEGVRRLLVQTSLGVGGSEKQLPVPLRQIAPIMLAKPLADHDAQEDVVRASGLDWTIVRPAGLTDRPATHRWRARSDGAGTLGGRVSRADVADCLLSCLDDSSSVGAQLGVSGP